jgi:hypothetical protein
MQKFGIPHPCGEDFSKMTVTERGAFCEKCSTDTYAFYSKSIPEIKSILRENLGQEICGRFAPEQIEAINAEFEAWTFRSKRSFQSAFAMALIVVFGLSLFSCSDKKQEIEITQFQKATKEIVVAFEKGIDFSEAAAGLNKAPEKFQLSLSGFPIVLDYFPFYSGWNMMPAGVVYVPDYMHNWLGGQMPFNTDTRIVYAVMGDSETEDSLKVDSVKTDPSSNIVTDPNLAGTASEFSAIAFPNPTTGTTIIEYKNLEKARYKIDVLDQNGKQLLDVFSGKIDEEIFRREINLTDFPPGTYIVVISSRKFREITRIVKN